MNKESTTLSRFAEMNSNFKEFVPIPRVSNLMPDEFECTYFTKKEPVIIERKLASWPAFQNWTPEVLKELFHDIVLHTTVNLPVVGAPGFRKWKNHSRRMPLGEFVDLMKVESNPCYIRQASIDNFPGIEIYFDFNVFMNLSEMNSSTHIWLGTKDTKSTLHWDTPDNFLAQVFGEKLVTLFSPEETKYLYPFKDQLRTSCIDPYHPDMNSYPNYSHARGMVGELKAGDALFIPKTWWHHLRSVDTSISLNCFFGNHCSTLYFLQVAKIGGMGHCVAVLNDFIRFGVFGRPYESRLISDIPTGKYLHNLMKSSMQQRFLKRQKV